MAPVTAGERSLGERAENGSALLTRGARSGTASDQCARRNHRPL